MENNLLNGFNDGLHRSSGVGGETFDYSIDLSQRKIIEAIEAMAQRIINNKKNKVA